VELRRGGLGLRRGGIRPRPLGNRQLRGQDERKEADAEG